MEKCANKEFESFPSSTVINDSRGYFKVDAFQMSQVHLAIAVRYEPKTTFENFKPKFIIATIDRYMMQLFEEIKEFLDEEDYNASASEMIDIMGYTFTLYNIVDQFLIHNNGEGVQPEPFPLATTRPILDCVVPPKVERDGYSSFIISSLISCRRMFPERKWHKMYDVATDDEIRERLQLFRAKLRSTIEAHFYQWDEWFGIDTFQKFYDQKIGLIRSTFC
jgi:hypothetical protein